MRNNGEFKTGDVLHCYSTSLLARAIRSVTKGRFNHTAVILIMDNLVFVADSQKDGTHLRPFNEWQRKYGYKWKLHRHLHYELLDHANEVRRRILSCVGSSPYDFKSLFITYPKYVFTGKWKPKNKFRALNRLFCSEFVAYVHYIDDFWKLSPHDLFEKLNSDPNYYVLWNDFNVQWRDKI